MATLTETAYLTRKSVNIGVIIVVILIALKITFSLATGLWQKIFPPPPPPATVAFGKLPYPAAQNNLATPSGVISYSLETATGALPEMPKNMKVFFMPRPGPSFGSFDKMKALATKIGFPDIPQKVGSTAWRFTDSTNPLRILDIDEVSDNFRLTYNYLSDLSLFNQKSFSSQVDVISSATSFFGGLGLSFGQPTLTYFKLDAGSLVPTTSLSSSDAVGVTFNRDAVDKIPVVSPDPKQGLVSVLLSPSSDQKRKILEGRYFFTTIDLENFATYPVISAAVAFDQLKNGNTIYASVPIPAPKSVTIRKIYLAYLDPYPPQSYLQPVLVFSDEKGFIAYIPVVSRDYLE